MKRPRRKAIIYNRLAGPSEPAAELMGVYRIYINVHHRDDREWLGCRVLGNSTSAGSLGSMQNKGRESHASQDDSEEFKTLKIPTHKFSSIATL